MFGASRFPGFVALSRLLWLLTDASWSGKVISIDPVTTVGYGRTASFVRLGNTPFNEDLIRQGLAKASIRYSERWDSKL